MTGPSVPVVYLVDDDASVRDGLRMLLESAGHAVLDFISGESFLEHYDPGRPCCLVLDLRMSGIGGLEVQSALVARGCRPPIIFLTGAGDVASAVTALKRGAHDFIEKPVQDTEDFLRRVQDALRRDTEALAESASRAAARRRLAELTPREREVMEAICSGKANKVIAADLGISERTVELHRSRVMRKLGVRSVASLIVLKDSAADG